MNEGEKCICQFDDWYNGFGKQTHAVHCGMRLTVTKVVRVGGATFYEFDETPEGTAYLCTGFKPLRNLN